MLEPGSVRFVVANFDAEIEMARGETPGPHPAIPAPVRRRLARYADELAVFGGPVAASAADVTSAEALLAWAETESIAAARRRLALPPSGSAPIEPTLGDASWIEALWSLVTDPAVVARCHGRGFWLELAEARGWTLEETHRIERVGDLERRLPAICARSQVGGWTAVAPFSAAGRERIHRWSAELPADIALRLERLIERYGWVLAAPWHRRELDFGVAGLVTARGPRCFSPHRQRVDDSGVFRAIEIETDPEWLEPERRAWVLEAARAAGEALAAAGYRGAFGIDGFLYRDASGSSRIHPMCEINSRLTFGLVARARWERRGRPARLAWQPNAH